MTRIREEEEDGQFEVVLTACHASPVPSEGCLCVCAKGKVTQASRDVRKTEIPFRFGF